MVLAELRIMVEQGREGIALVINQSVLTMYPLRCNVDGVGLS